MSVEMWLGLAIAVAAMLYYRLSKQSQKAAHYKQAYHSLENQYQALQKTLSTRGQRMDVLLSTISEVVLRVDKKGRVLGGNAQANKLFQFDSAPALPQAMLVFYRDSEWVNSFYQAMQSLPAQKNLPEMNVDGRILSPKLAALNDDEALLLCLDVTAYTKLQRKQKSLLENLMHDLKTPLTSLLGYARSIEAFADDKALREEAAEVIAQEAKYINDLINSMLTLNQIELQENSGNQACDLSIELQRVWQSLGENMQHKRIALSMDKDMPPTTVAISDMDCHRVLLNIAENAVKFTPQDSQITCKVHDLNERFVQVSIQDEGDGIQDSLLDRVTERFFRVDEVRGREKKEGHGLGLAIAHEILERDGGELSLHNVDTGGLRVDIKLPKA